jgi:hypothetical protein
MNITEMWDYLLDNSLVSEETLQVVTDINGYSAETLESILYAVTGYRNFEQIKKEQ